MPFIDVKITRKLTDEQKLELKAKLGESISIMHKPESYLMVGIADGYDLYFAGKKLANGAYVGVKLFGKPAAGDCARMTKALCDLLGTRFGIPSDCVYVTYQGISDWGWDGGNF